ncbi:MAG TPA: FAD-dependent oxidoreductase [Thermomicrobiales bacterium]|nr:FAD-dependent oxidoreductase [Thermomicrobiales bacterium]
MQNGHTPNGGGSGSTSDSRNIIMGAGPAGLCSAYVLSKAGVNATVVESAPFVGGLARTIRRDTEQGEFKFDIGGHRWFTKNDELNELFREVVDDELLWVERISRIYFDGKFIDYPLKIGSALKAVGPVTAARAVADYGRSRVQQKVRPHDIVSMEDAYIDQYGETLYKLFFQAYSEKVWGKTCDQLSGDWVSQRTKGMSLVTAIKDAVVPSKGEVVSLIDQFMYPRRGFGRFSERMADAISASGNDIRLQTAVEKIVLDGKRVKGIQVKTANGSELIEGENFISSIPFTVLVKIMDPVAPADVIKAADALTFRDIITVNLMIRKPQVTHDTWLYVHDRNILFGRFHEPKNWSPAMVPGDEYTSLVIEYFCTRGDHIWNMSDQQLVNQSVKHLVEDLGFLRPEEVLGGFTLRATKAYPVYDLDYQEPLAKMKDYIQGIENLQYIGRGGSFRYNNTDHSIETGLLAAKNLLGEHHDLERVNAEEEYHEIKREKAPASVA